MVSHSVIRKSLRLTICHQVKSVAYKNENCQLFNTVVHDSSHNFLPCWNHHRGREILINDFSAYTRKIISSHDKLLRNALSFETITVKKRFIKMLSYEVHMKSTKVDIDVNRAFRTPLSVLSKKPFNEQ